ncbi:RNA binding protein [Alternaria alternata]|nr:RNA binding protein [Alternaria alternata]
MAGTPHLPNLHITGICPYQAFRSRFRAFIGLGGTLLDAKSCEEQLHRESVLGGGLPPQDTLLRATTHPTLVSLSVSRSPLRTTAALRIPLAWATPMPTVTPHTSRVIDLNSAVSSFQESDRKSFAGFY